MRIQPERPSVIFTRTMVLYSTAVFLGGITFVGFPSIIRVFFANSEHVFISKFFGKYAGSSYGSIFAVPFDDAVVFVIFIWFEPIPVDQ